MFKVTPAAAWVLVSLIPEPKLLYHAIILPSYNHDMRHTTDISKKRGSSNTAPVLVGGYERFEEKDGTCNTSWRLDGISIAEDGGESIPG